MHDMCMFAEFVFLGEHLKSKSDLNKLDLRHILWFDTS